jgi:hypothetical protein
MAPTAPGPVDWRVVATAYLDHGWPVVPVHGKAVMVRWKPYQDDLPTPSDVAGWPWDRATGLAVVIGPAFWVRHPHRWCLEIEARHRAEAEPWLDAELGHWRTAGLVAESGGGGLHVYCETSAAVRSTGYRWGEIRGAGNICVLPPSRHPSGRLYRWLVAVEPVVLDPAAVPGSAERDRLCFDEDSGLIDEGARNDTLFRLGCRLRRCGLASEEVSATLAVVNASRCRPPLDEAEVAKIARSAGCYAAAADRASSTWRGLRVREVRRA